MGGSVPTYSAFLDEGINGCGIAAFVGAELLRAAYVPCPLGPKDPLFAREVAMGRAAHAWLVGLGVSTCLRALRVERPRVLDPTHQRKEKRGADPNDLLSLTAVAGALGALLPPGVELSHAFPDEWKGGSVEKHAMNARVWKRLTEAERARVDRRSRAEPGGNIGLDHNTLDGVGIGLDYHGRLERLRVFG